MNLYWMTVLAIVLNRKKTINEFATAIEKLNDRIK